MVSVEEAERIIHRRTRDYGTESLPTEQALGRFLAAPVVADRDMPPFDRVTLDGIALRFQSVTDGIREFHVARSQAAGEDPGKITRPDECVEIMTGAARPSSTDTIIPFEDIEKVNGQGIYLLREGSYQFGQNIHVRGRDRKAGEILVNTNQWIGPPVIAAALSAGRTELEVRKFPKTMVISTGDELLGQHKPLSAFQIRRSNDYMLASDLQLHGLRANTNHLPDDPVIISAEIGHCLREYDVIILCGGVSMGKHDYVPGALEQNGVKPLFYKVAQRPGKPFWFGEHASGVLVFAFPGNPVSCFLCLHRYFLPWLYASAGQPIRPVYAQLGYDFEFKPDLQYFLQVRLEVNEKGMLIGTPAEGNGSGDFANLLASDAFLELPLGREKFSRSESFRVWPFKNWT